MISGRYWSLVSSWSLAPIEYDWWAPSKAPLAWLTLEAATAVRTFSMVSPYDEADVEFTWMRTAGFWPPLMLTRPTPGSCDIFCARRVSARSSTFDSGRVFEVSARVMMGASAGFVLL